MRTMTNPPNALRRVLLLDATASGGMGVLFLVAGDSLGSVLGLPLNLVRSVGVFLVPFGMFLVWVATRRYSLPAITRAIVIGNVLWVIASVWLLVSGLVKSTLLGGAFVLAQAAAVVVFAALEYRGLRFAQNAIVAEHA